MGMVPVPGADVTEAPGEAMMTDKAPRATRHLGRRRRKLKRVTWASLLGKSSDGEEDIEGLKVSSSPRTEKKQDISGAPGADGGTKDDSSLIWSVVKGMQEGALTQRDAVVSLKRKVDVLDTALAKCKHQVKAIWVEMAGLHRQQQSLREDLDNHRKVRLHSVKD